MTREEAICELSVIWERLSHPEDCENGCYSFRDGDYLEALDMAIEALSNNITESPNEANKRQNDAIDLVRCKDCIHYESDGGALMVCRIDDMVVDDTDYCSYGERKGGDDE